MIPFIDLHAQRHRLGARLDEAVSRVLDHGSFVMGPEVHSLEARLAEFCGCDHAIACSSGTDALLLAMMALGVGPGDAVLVPGFTFAAPAEMVALLGATPVFLDVELNSCNVGGSALKHGVDCAKSYNLRPVGAIPVDLYGRPADYGGLEAAAKELGIWLICDAAQSFGGEFKGSKVGSFGCITTTSFYPAKPLGCYGDGGAVFTDDAGLADKIRSILMHGMGKDKYDNVRIGINGRLDTIQAAILLEKLEVFDEELELRDAAASAYSDGLSDIDGLAVPQAPESSRCTWAQYTLRLDGFERDGFRKALASDGIPTAVHYPLPLHRQGAYRQFPTAGSVLDASDRLSETVVSLPMHPYLDESVQSRIVGAVRRASGH